MNIGILAVLITLYFAIALLSVYLALRSTRRYLKKTAKRIRRQRDQDLRFHREALLAHMRLEAARRP